MGNITPFFGILSTVVDYSNVFVVADTVISTVGPLILEY